MRKKGHGWTYQRAGMASALAIIVGIPLVFVPEVARDVFAVWKVTILAVAIVILVVAWLVRCRSEGRVALTIPYYAISLLLLALAYALATAFSVDMRESIFGTYSRFEGLLVISGYMLIGFLVPTVIERRHIDRLLNMWLATGSAIAAYGLLQYAGVGLQDWQGSFVGTRVFSTLGNPLTLSAYIILTLPIAYARVLHRRDITAIAFIALGIPALLATHSRSAWLAFILVTLLFLAFVVGRFRHNVQRRAVASPFLRALLVVILAATIALFFVGDLGPRLASSFDVGSGTVAARLNLWKLTVDMISERPAFGYGPETFLQVSTEFLDIAQQQIEVNTRYDRPHNDLLHVAFSTGLVGLLAYLAFAYITLTGALHYVRRSDEPDDALTVAGLTLGVLGYLVAIQFYFSTVAVSPLMWLAIGLIAIFVGAEETVLRRNMARVVAPAAVAGCLVLLLPHPLMLAADIASKKALVAEDKADMMRAAEFARLATQLSPWRVEYALWQGQVLEAAGDTDGAIAAYGRATKVSPGRYDGYAHLAAMYYQRQDASNSLQYAFKALERYPLHYESRMMYALISAMEGDNATAEENLAVLERIDPNDYRAFLYLGLLYRDTGREEMAREQLRKALVLSPDNPDAKQALSSIDARDR